MASYSIPLESEKVFRDGILNNKLVNKYIPGDARELASLVRFEGSDAPSLPINWRFAESISALLAYEAVTINDLLKKKYGVSPGTVTINTDHAQLFIMSIGLWKYDTTGSPFCLYDPPSPEGYAGWVKGFPSWDVHNAISGDKYRTCATNIYQCKDHRYYHIHGSMNPDFTLAALGMPKSMVVDDWDTANQPFIDAMKNLTSEEVDRRCVKDAKQAGTPALSVEEYRNSDHGKANAHVGLFEIFDVPSSAQAPCWWPESPMTSPARPLAGLKVVEITRVIAGPTIGRGLAELGASVMRITAPQLPDFSMMHPDLNQGKWTTLLDLRTEENRQRLHELIMDADVFLTGYRPGVLDKWGFGESDVLKMCEKRGRGIICARENCFGWNGPLKDRSGWQQISDAACGVSLGFGRAMGLDEPVTPPFPNSDSATGLAGTIAILTALIKRAEYGGSFRVETALNYYSRWLTDHVGEYPREVFEDVWNRNGRQVWRHTDHMGITMRAFVLKVTKSKIWKSEYFMDNEIKHLGKTLRTVKPVLQFSAESVQPGFAVGARGNGVDKPYWPKDLGVEVVA